MRMLKTVGLVLCFMLACSACSSGSGAVAQVVAYFTTGYELPQTRSAESLATYMSSEHEEYDLDGWFFFGSLEDEVSGEPAAFIISMQRIAQEYGGLVWQTVPAIVAYNDSALGRYAFGGTFTLDVFPLVEVSRDPWLVEINSLDQLTPIMSMGLVSGTMGQPGALYLLTADLPDSLGGRLAAEVLLYDRLGVVNQGYGTASFFPQFITPYQRFWIEDSYEGSVGRYLEATGDTMAGQGSFYYSLPLLDVWEFVVWRDGEVQSYGTSGTMWMDDIVQSYGSVARDVLIGQATWQFFSIMLPDEDAAMMVIEIESADGLLPVAKLFDESGERTQNSALSAAYSWGTDEVAVEAVPSAGIWTSPVTGQRYVQEHRISLDSEERSADLSVRMVREDQEIMIDLTSVGGGTTIKYEGLATVTGTLDGRPVKGTAIVELQPYGYQ